MVLVAAPEYFTIGVPTPIPADVGTFVYSAVLTQLDGVTPLGAGMLQTLTLTLRDVDTDTIINSRDDQDVLNVSDTGVTVDVSGSTGALQWIGGTDDNPFVRLDPPAASGDVEYHRATFIWTWLEDSVTYANSRKVFIAVEKYDGTVSPTGTGDTLYSDYVYQPDGVTPVADAEVWITSDAGGAIMVAGPQRTNSSGQFFFMLDAGTYYAWVDSEAYQPTSAEITVP